MLTSVVTAAGTAWAHGPGQGPWHHGPGWWIVFPILFWTVLLSVAGYLIYRGSGRQSARRAAEHALAQMYARGEITADELRERRAVLRRR